MAAKRAPFDVRSLVVRDNVPEGMTVSLAGIAPARSFAALFRDELQARGIGIHRETQRELKKLD
nr:hypothetical protein [Dechloromonas sp.]